MIAARHIPIIAEAGVNHNGSIDLALRLVDAAAAAGADIVKFQTFKAETIVAKSAQMAEYQKTNTGRSESQYAMLKRLELTDDDHRRIMERCREQNIGFLSTAFDVEGVAYLDGLGLRLHKVPSGELTNLPYLRAIAACGKSVLLSTGMATEAEVAAAMGVLAGCEVTLMHCTTAYPCPFEAVNLNALQTLHERFGCPVGYSDHTRGITIPIAAVAMGAQVIEKHFTLDRDSEGPDHRASLEPAEFQAMVRAIRELEAAFGDGVKVPTAAEMMNVAVARKSLVAKRAIRKGDVFTADNLTVKRPGTGISPMRWDEFIGKPAEHDYAEDDLI